MEQGSNRNPNSAPQVSTPAASYLYLFLVGHLLEISTGQSNLAFCYLRVKGAYPPNWREAYFQEATFKVHPPPHLHSLIEQAKLRAASSWSTGILSRTGLSHGVNCVGDAGRHDSCPQNAADTPEEQQPRFARERALYVWSKTNKTHSDSLNKTVKTHSTVQEWDTNSRHKKGEGSRELLSSYCPVLSSWGSGLERLPG